MIIAFKVVRCKELDVAVDVLRKRYRSPKNFMEFADKPYGNTIIKIKGDVLVIKIDVLYKYLNPVMYLLTNIVFNRFLFKLAIKRVLRKSGYNEKIKLLSNEDLIQRLI